MGITWLVYSPHCDPPPLAREVAFGASDAASGSNTMRMKRAEHPVQPAGLVKDRTDMAVSPLVCSYLVTVSGGGVLHHHHHHHHRQRKLLCRASVVTFIKMSVTEECPSLSTAYIKMHTHTPILVSSYYLYEDFNRHNTPPCP